MSHRTKRDARRAMGWATLVGGLFVLLFWTLYFTGAAELGQDHPVIAEFEAAFPIADAFFAVTLFAASYALFKGKAPGAFLLAGAGSVSLYLGILDATFYARQGHYSPITGTALVELAVNAFCVIGGALAMWFGWRFMARREPGAQKARRRAVRDRVIVLSGSVSAMGAAAARRLAGAGAALVLADRDEPALERQRRELAAAGAKAVAIPADVSDPESVEQLVEGALLAFGRVDVLVNFAGIRGTIHTTRALLPYFRRRGDGQLINVAPPGGDHGFYLSLAHEMRDAPIHVSLVSSNGRTPAAEDVAEAIVNTIRRPKAEFMFRRWQDRLAKLAAWGEWLRTRTFGRGASEPELAHKGAW
ncbi:MAG: SDR family NAD(P)-dependent oxidoreductase [Gemmatimonadota bacterium]|nr:MAG: SDR family NAD(P)-dependent oxidoreductase [Gemmatimonadota bacterium]